MCNNFLSGRPFGGTAVSIHKTLATSCTRIFTDNPRITSVCLTCGDHADVVVSSVYSSRKLWLLTLQGKS